MFRIIRLIVLLVPIISGIVKLRREFKGTR